MKQLRISVLTFAMPENYGAVLQAYALGKVLRDMGHEVQFIDYTWTSSQKFYLLSILTPLKRKFSNFRKIYMKNFSKKCKTETDLRKAVEGFDVCIVGSDQVWNPDITDKRALHYFFDFVPDDILKISYAASFGVKEWKWKNLTPKIKELLNKFKAVSVREYSGVEICNDNFAVRATKVLDPTLLLGDFSHLLLPSEETGFVLGYAYKRSNEYYDFIREAASALQTKGMVMDVFPRDLRKTSGMKKCFSPSPLQWLTVIANSRFVITDSYHALAFAIIFKRNFIVVPTGNLGQLNDRMMTLLQDLDLEDRIFNSLAKARESRIWEKSINYEEVDTKLSVLRADSVKFLKESLTDDA